MVQFSIFSQPFFNVSLPNTNINFLTFMLFLVKICVVNAPLFTLSLFSLTWIYFSRRFTSLAVKATEKFLTTSISKETYIKEMFALSKTLMLDCLIKSVIWWSRPCFETYIQGYFENKEHSDRMRLTYETFHEYGPAIHCTKIYRTALAIKDAASLLIYDMLSNIISLFISMSVLYNILETRLFYYLISMISFIVILQSYLMIYIRRYKKQAQEIDEIRAKDMTEIFENSFLTRNTNTDEKERLRQFFVSDALLKFTIGCTLVNFQNMIFMVLLCFSLLMLSKGIKIAQFLYHSDAVARAFNQLIAKFIELYAKKIEMIDIARYDKKEEICENESIYDINSACPIVSDHVLMLQNINIYINNRVFLRDINLSFKQGDSIALIGSNGSGKTTFLRFLLTFHKHNGKMSYTGNEVFNIPKNQITYIPQSMHLFRTAYEELMEYSSSEEEMYKTCEMFTIHKELIGLEKGYNTSVSLLSASQRQLISLVRAYLRKSTFLLADEPTSCLDSKTEQIVLDNLVKSPNHCVKIVAFHDFSYISKFTRVLHCDDNRIIEIIK